MRPDEIEDGLNRSTGNSKSTLAAYFKADLVGIAFFDSDSNLIRIMEDVEESNSFDIISQRIL